MAVGLKSRIICREKGSGSGTDYWAGTYKLLMRAKSIPSPIGAPNMVDVSTLEDEMEVQEKGRRAAASMTVQGAFTKANKDYLIEMEDKDLDIMILYGSDGKGSEGICAFCGTETFAPDEANDGHLTGTATVAIKTQAKWIEDTYEVTSVSTDEFGYPTSITVAKKSALG